jgi:hypothetical protein
MLIYFKKKCLLLEATFFVIFDIKILSTQYSTKLKKIHCAIMYIQYCSYELSSFSDPSVQTISSVHCSFQSQHSLFTLMNVHVLPSANPVWRILVPYITSMSMMVIGHSLLYKDKDGAVCCMMFIDLLDDRWCLTGSKYLEYNSRNRQWTIKTVQ